MEGLEGIASIMAGMTEGSRPQHRQPEQNPTLSPDSNQPTTNEEIENEYRIRSDKAVADKWIYNQEPPEPSQCQFCGKTLYYYGVTFPQQRRIMVWYEEPEHCDCQQAQKHWRQHEEAKKKAEQDEKQRQEQERIQNRVAKLMKSSGIRGRFQTRTFDRFEVNKENQKAYQAAKRYADSFPMMLPTKDERGNTTPPRKERNGLFVTGSYGTGKTHLAAAVANQLIQAGTPVICLTMIDLLARIKQTFDRADNATEADIMRIYEEIPLLIIDDIGSEQSTEWGVTKVFAIINARYEAFMPTIITTNYSAEELIRRMTPTGGDSRNAEKTLDRLKEMCVGLEMFWESWRPR